MVNLEKVSHVTGGFRKILELSPLYMGLANLVAGKALRKKLIDECIRPKENSRILDIGCGPAALLELLPNGVRYIGFDLNPGYIANAKRRYGSRGEFFCERAGADFSRKNLGTFDIVLALGLFHHLDDGEALALLETAWSVLEPGGTLVTLDTVHVENPHWFSKWVTSMDRGQNTRTPQAYLNLVHSKFAHVEGRVVTHLTRLPHYTLYTMRSTKN